MDTVDEMKVWAACLHPDPKQPSPKITVSGGALLFVNSIFVGRLVAKINKFPKLDE